MTRKKWDNRNTQALVRALFALKNPDQAKRFLRDLLTEAELIEFGNRWQAARMLDRGVSYTAIAEATGLSSRTIARIKRWLTNGMGGYRLMLKNLGRHHANSFPAGSGLR